MAWVPSPTSHVQERDTDSSHCSGILRSIFTSSARRSSAMKFKIKTSRTLIGRVGGAVFAAIAPAASADSLTDALKEKVAAIVVIYAENRSFDSLFGTFPGAHGLSEVTDGNGHPTSAYIPQKDRDGSSELPKLPQTWNGVPASGNSDANGNLRTSTPPQPQNPPNPPFPT